MDLLINVLFVIIWFLPVEVKLIESFRLCEGDDYEYEIFSILTSGLGWANVILPEKVIAAIILLRNLARMSKWQEQVIKF